MHLLNFEEWKTLNESKITDKFKNLFSWIFGGKVKDLDNLLSEYKKSELRFVSEWEEIKVEIDRLGLEKSNYNVDLADSKRIERMIERNNNVIETSKRAKEKKANEISVKAKSIIGDNKRLQDYWEVNKSKVDSEIAEEIYRKSKNISDKSASDDLYSKYKESLDKAKGKAEKFKTEYGDLYYWSDHQSSNYVPLSKRQEDFTNIGGIESNFELLSNLSLHEFSDSVKSLNSRDLKKLLSFLITKRNNKYLAKNMETDSLNVEISKKSGDTSTKEYAAKRIKEIRDKYSDELNSLKLKITIVRNHAN